MAIGTIQLHEWTGWTAADGLHVECVIQLDGCWVTAVFAYHYKFRMPIGQVVNVLRVT